MQQQNKEKEKGLPPRNECRGFTPCKMTSIDKGDGNITIVPSTVDWALLRTQKLALVEMLWSCRNHSEDLTSEQIEAVQGIVHFIDSIQDKAADIIGEEKVFCDEPTEARAKTQLEIATELATRAHAGQLRTKDDDKGKPYIIHPTRVAAKLTGCSDNIQAAAMLHDVLEDTSFTRQMLADAGINASVINLVRLLTRPTDMDYAQYIDRIVSYGDDAIIIKLADIEDNLATLPAGSLRDKYELASYILMEHSTDED